MPARSDPLRSGPRLSVRRPAKNFRTSTSRFRIRSRATSIAARSRSAIRPRPCTVRCPIGMPCSRPTTWPAWVRRHGARGPATDRPRDALANEGQARLVRARGSWATWWPKGAAFTARGERLTYSQEKDQLVLRGDGLSPAEFFQEDASGRPPPRILGQRADLLAGNATGPGHGVQVVQRGLAAQSREKTGRAVAPRERCRGPSILPRPIIVHGIRDEHSRFDVRPIIRSTAIRAESNFSTASRPVIPGVTPRPSAALLTSKILALKDLPALAAVIAECHGRLPRPG